MSPRSFAAVLVVLSACSYGAHDTTEPDARPMSDATPDEAAPAPVAGGSGRPGREKPSGGDGLLGIGTAGHTLVALREDGERIVVHEFAGGEAPLWVELRVAGRRAAAVGSFPSGHWRAALLDGGEAVTALDFGVGNPAQVIKLTPSGDLALLVGGTYHILFEGELRALPPGVSVESGPDADGVWPAEGAPEGSVDKEPGFGFYDPRTGRFTPIAAEHAATRPQERDGRFIFGERRGADVAIIDARSSGREVLAEFPARGSELQLALAQDWVVVLQDGVPTHRIALDDRDIHEFDAGALDVQRGQDRSFMVRGAFLLATDPNSRWPLYRLDIAQGAIELLDQAPDLDGGLRLVDAAYCHGGVDLLSDGRLGFAARDSSLAYYFLERPQSPGQFDRVGMAARDILILSGSLQGDLLLLTHDNGLFTYCPAFDPFDQTDPAEPFLVGNGRQLVDAVSPARFEPLTFSFGDTTSPFFDRHAFQLDHAGDRALVELDGELRLYHLPSGDHETLSDFDHFQLFAE